LGLEVPFAQARPDSSLASSPSANYQPYALPPHSPRKYRRIKPSSGSSTAVIIQVNFFPLGTELFKNIDNRPDITSDYQQASEAVVSDVHHFWFLPCYVKSVNPSRLMQGI
jgi:hypothetical protein